LSELHPFIDKTQSESFIDGLYVTGTAYGGYDNPKLTYSKSVKMWQGSNKISILSSAMGLAVS
jgi:archaellum component FlaF (FlaF/FlaG flagellin family)